jgi:hypothetical protein
MLRLILQETLVYGPLSILFIRKFWKQTGEPAGAIGAKAAWKQRREVDQAGQEYLSTAYCRLPTG